MVAAVMIKWQLTDVAKTLVNAAIRVRCDWWIDHCAAVKACDINPAVGLVRHIAL